MFMEISAEETEYRWIETAKLYGKTLESGSMPSGFSAAEYWQKIGHFCDLASRQAANTDDFKSLRRRSTDAFEKTGTLFNEEQD